MLGIYGYVMKIDWPSPKSLLTEYESNPSDSKYSQAVGEAKAILGDQQKKKVRTAKQIRSRSEVFQQDLVVVEFHQSL